MVFAPRSRAALVRERAQRRLGLSIRREPLFGSLDWELRRLIELHGIGLVLDVGANEGKFVERLRCAGGFRGDVVSFEPGPIATVAERAAADDPRWSVERVALGAENTVKTLHVAAGSDLSSLHAPLARAAEMFPAVATQSAIDVPVLRLDSLWDEIGAAGRAVLLKSDTQGHDMEVVAGCGERLADVVVVLIEASNVQLYENQPPIEETIEELRRLGFLLCSAFPVSRRVGVTVEFDCVFARSLS